LWCPLGRLLPVRCLTGLTVWLLLLWVLPWLLPVRPLLAWVGRLRLASG
jgi:hypothetical protein